MIIYLKLKLMILLILYWFITTMMAIGVGHKQEGEFTVFDIVWAIFFGWFAIPIKLGILITN